MTPRLNFFSQYIHPYVGTDTTFLHRTKNKGKPGKQSCESGLLKSRLFTELVSKGKPVSFYLCDEIIRMKPRAERPENWQPMVQIAQFDLDDHDGATTWAQMVDAAKKITATAKQHGVHLIAFKSKGGKGIHLYARWEQPTYFGHVRKALRGICEEIDFKEGQKGVADQELEIFPNPVCSQPVAVPGGGEGGLLDADYELVEFGAVDWPHSEPLSTHVPKPTELPKFNGKTDHTRVPEYIRDEWQPMPLAMDELTAALSHCDPDAPYWDTKAPFSWGKAIMALSRHACEHEEHAQALFDLADKWSAGGLHKTKARKYDGTEKIKEIWHDARSVEGTILYEQQNGPCYRVDSIFKHAEEQGWERPDDTHRQEPPEPFNPLTIDDEEQVEALTFPAKEFLSVDQYRYCEAIAHLSNQPVEAVCSMMIFAVGLAAGARTTVKALHDFEQTPSPWVQIIMPPGFQKTGSWGRVTKPIVEFQRERQRTHEKRLREWEEAGQMGGEEAEERGPRPIREVVYDKDATIEARIKQLSQNPNGMGYMSDEMSSFVKQFGQYRANGKGADAEYYLSAWSNDPYSKIRAGIDPNDIIHMNADRGYCPVGGVSTPESISKTIEGADLENGWIFRFLNIVVPDGFTHNQHIDETDFDAVYQEERLWQKRLEETEGAWNKALRAVLFQCRQLDGDLVVTFDDEADRRFARYNWDQQRIARDRELDPVQRGIHAKNGRHVLMLCGVHALLNQGADELAGLSKLERKTDSEGREWLQTRPVSLRAVETCIRMAERYQQHMSALLDLRVVQVQDAKKLAEVLKRCGRSKRYEELGYFTLSDVTSVMKVFGKHTGHTDKDIYSIFRTLNSFGIIRESSVISKRGKKTPRFEINPEWINQTSTE
ncbi:MAG: DUF3987 domain-containing protein [Pseudomonadaceae bacterium]|nr:DUF3987 domain-containing protein [Pseudomonadaceae bacterium]